MKHLLIIAWLLINVSSGVAGRGGHSVAFDSNSYGGGWTCFRTQASGACGAGTFAQYFDASCSGTGGQSADDTAISAWITYGLAQGALKAKLYIPPGSDCWFTASTTSLVMVNGTTNPAIQNAIVWGYGATLHRIGIGGRALLGGWNINTASQGDSNVVLVTAGDSSNFVVGNWVLIGAEGLQTFGEPQNLQLFEYAVVTAINSGTLTLSSPLSQTYLSTWPIVNSFGPASIFKMETSWNINLQLFGMTFASYEFNGNQVSVTGRNIILNDVIFAETAGNMSPGPSNSLWFIGGQVRSPEVDKLINSVNFVKVAGGQIQVQSASVNSMQIISSALSSKLNGTAITTSIVNSSFPSITAGTTTYGRARNLSLDGVTFTTANNRYLGLPASVFSYSAGTFSIAKVDVATPFVYQVFVPGFKYFFGNSDSSNTCTPANTFTVTALRECGANICMDTNIVGSLPSSSCGTINYGAYQVETFSAKFSGPGNLLSNPEMLPP